MIQLILKRTVAYFIDYFLILLYAITLLFVTLSIAPDDYSLSPIQGQLVALISLTIPAYFYLVLSESGKQCATIGKRIMRLKVTEQSIQHRKNIWLRNLIKLLPWEIAHTGVQWAFYYNNQNVDPPMWTMILFIVAQSLVFLYFMGTFIFKGEATFYDKLSNTKVVFAT